jgi:hypothetical protein
VTETALGTCADCGRPRKPDAIFCECGALLDYSVAPREQPTNAKSNGDAVATNVDADAANGDAAPANDAAELEWPPGPYQALKKRTESTIARSIELAHCPNETCKALNPKTFVFCWRCGTPMEEGVETGPSRSWSLRRALRLDKPPLPAGERAAPRKPFLGKDPLTLVRAGLIVLAGLVLLVAAVIAIVEFSGPAGDHVAHWYGTSREALFPRFSSVNPSAVRPVRIEHRKKVLHPAADAFDRNLSTYWQTTTARDVTDQLSAIFKPSARQIDEVAVYAGDPTASTIVPQSLQLTFFRWVQHPSRYPDCSSEQAPKSEWKKGKEKGRYCVIEVGKVYSLQNTPSEQRFATGSQPNVSKVVVTVRGVHRADNPKAKAAITDIEFFDKH